MLLINNQEVEKLLDMKSCLEALEDAYDDLLKGDAVYRPRLRHRSCDRPDGYYRSDAIGRGEPKTRRICDSDEVRHCLLAQGTRRKVLHAAGNLVRLGDGLQRSQRRAAGDYQ